MKEPYTFVSVMLYPCKLTVQAAKAASNFFSNGAVVPDAPRAVKVSVWLDTSPSQSMRTCAVTLVPVAGAST